MFDDLISVQNVYKYMASVGKSHFRATTQFAIRDDLHHMPRRTHASSFARSQLASELCPPNACSARAAFLMENDASALKMSAA